MENVCVEPNCTYGTRLVADKDVASVRHITSSGSATYLYPSKRCPSGLCYYHFTKRYFAKLWVKRELDLMRTYKRDVKHIKFKKTIRGYRR